MIRIGKILAFLIVPLFVYLAIVNPSLSVITPVVEVYTPSDEETNYLTALSVYRGEGLYKNFSISYPPGRFIAQALYFRLTEPTVVSSRIYMNLFSPLLFPTLLFFLTYRLAGSYFLAWLALILDLTLVHSAQEVHVLIAAFLLVLLSKLKLKNYFLGLLLGLVFLFRLEAGIIVTLSLVLAYRTLPKCSAVLGFATIWIPVFANLIYHSSLTNFFYDTIVLGLITQPRVMGQAIPNNALWAVFLSTLIAILSFSLSLWQKGDKRIKVVAAVSLLSYVSALGRSDEGHLWYALLFLPLVFIVAITSLGKFRSGVALFLGVVLFSVSYLIITIKSPPFFLFIASILLLGSHYFRRYYKETIIGGALASLLVFHSLSYLSLRLQVPRFVPKLASPWRLSSSATSIGGLDFPADTLKDLASLKSRIEGGDPELFIFPDHTLYYEYFAIPRPTRYFYLSGERTLETEREIIASLSASENLYILVFPEKASDRGGEIWDWIKGNTRIIATEGGIDLRSKLF